MIEEVTVVCYSDYCTLVLLQVLFQPIDTFRIEVVGRLIEQQDIGFLKQQTTQSHTAAFTSRQVLHRLVFGRTTQRIHSTFKLAIEVPSICSVDNILQFGLSRKKSIHLTRILIIFGQSELIVNFFVFGQSVYYTLYAFHHYFLYGFGIVKMRFLSQITDGISRREYHLSLIVFIQTGYNLHQGRLTRPVQTDNTDLRSVEKR